MTRFSYTGTNTKTGQAESGTMDAQSAQDAELRLSERGLRGARVTVEKSANTIRATTATAPRPPLPAPAPFAFAPAVPPADLATFFRQMASLLHAGFTPISALADLAPRTANRCISRAASDIGMAIGTGEPFGASVAKHANVFPPHIAGLIHAGETGGFLEEACEEAALGAEGDAALRQGLWIPKILFWQSVWSFLILQPMLNHLSQTLGGAFNSGGAMVGVMAMVREFLFFWLPFGMFLHFLCYVGGMVWRQPGFAPTRDRLLLILPVMRKLSYTRAVAGFTRLLRKLLLSGISPETAFVAASNAVPNTVYRNQLLSGGVPVLRAGNGLDAAMQASGMLEHDPLQLLITGQRTGQWSEMLDKVTAYYQDAAVKATDDAKNAQKRAAILITMVSVGYVTIGAVAGPLKATMDVFGGSGFSE